MIALHLTPADLAQARYFGRKRNAVKEQAGVPSRKHTPSLADEAIHILGIKAEIAVAHLLGVDFDDRVFTHGDGGIDLRWRGWELDVKMRSTGGSDLICMADLSDFRADAAVLCWAGNDEHTVYAVGIIDRCRFQREARPDVLPGRLVMPWKELRQLRMIAA